MSLRLTTPVLVTATLGLLIADVFCLLTRLIEPSAFGASVVSHMAGVASVALCAWVHSRK